MNIILPTLYKLTKTCIFSCVYVGTRQMQSFIYKKRAFINCFMHNFSTKGLSGVQNAELHLNQPNLG